MSRTWRPRCRFFTSISTAAPLVSGTLALMMAVRPGLSPSEAIAALRGSAKPFVTSGASSGTAQCRAPNGTELLECYCTTSTCGAGMLDASAAVTAALALNGVSVQANAAAVAGQSVSLTASATGLPADNDAAAAIAGAAARAQAGADAVLVKKLHSLPNVTVHTNTQTTAITGADGKVNGLKYKNRETGEESLLALEGVFVQIGLVPNTEWLKGTVDLSKFGEILVDAKGHTNVPGVFAAGDCTTVPFKQIVIAAGEGAKAALSAFDHLIRH